MWNIHGKKYDFTSFLDRHPGGKFILERTRGLPDITALFESYHAFSDIQHIEEIMKKYEIKDTTDTTDTSAVENTITTTIIPSSTPSLDRKDFSSYRELVKRVKTQFPKTIDIKANSIWITYNSVIFSLAAVFFYGCYFSDIAFTYKIICQIFYSICESSIQSNLMHEGSHFAISIYPEINILLSNFAHRIILWNLNVWFYHHVYNHHSYTGSENDPDDSLFQLEYTDTDTTIIQKHTLINIIHTFFPGQYTGQSLLYFVSPFTGKFHHMITPSPRMMYYNVLDIVFMVFKIYVLYHAGIIQGIIHFTILNTLYYINIIPNHSTYENKIDNKYVGKDWMKMQICNTGNFITENRWWTCLFGGINYQIEHHLFPNMCSIHYPAVSKIVQEYCKEQNIPYVNKSSLFEAYDSYKKFIYYSR